MTKQKWLERLELPEVSKLVLESKSWINVS